MRTIGEHHLGCAYFQSGGRACDCYSENVNMEPISNAAVEVIAVEIWHEYQAAFVKEPERVEWSKARDEVRHDIRMHVRDAILAVLNMETEAGE